MSRGTHSPAASGNATADPGHGRRPLALRPFAAADLPLVEPWFDDPQTQRWLGGRDWPAMVLRAEAVLPFARTYLVCDGAIPVVLATFEIDAEGDAAIAIVTTPTARRRGYGAAALRLLFVHAEAAGARRFVAGIEVGNAVSEALVCNLGFLPRGGVDAEGFRSFILSRPSLSPSALSPAA